MKNIGAPLYKADITDRSVKCNCAASATRFYLPHNAEGEITITKTDSSANVVTVLPYKGEVLIDATLQAETATVIGAVTKSGNATVVLTAAGMAGTPLTLSVAVLEGDAIATTANKIRNVLSSTVAVTDMFTVSGSGANIVLTQIEPTGNDATLNISIDNGTCEGLTTAGTSTNTKAGVAVTIATQNAYKTFTNSGSGWVKTDSGGVNETETLTNKTLTSPTLTTPTITDMTIGVGIVAAENLVAGNLVYPSGYDGTAGKIKVTKADADANDPAKVAWFVMAGTVAQDAAGTAYGAYELTGQNTSSASAVGDPVYLDTTAGGWSLTAPTGGGQIKQQVGVVTVKHASTGKVLLMPLYSKAVTVNTTE
jgi:hypothetical protein